MQSILKIVKAVFLLCLLAAQLVRGDSISREQWLRIQSLHGVFSNPGINNPSLYVFFDPNCAASARLFSTTLKSGPFEKVDAVWIPVSYMGPTSLRKAVAILREADFSSVKKNYLSFNFRNGLGALKEVEPTNSEISEILQANNVWKNLSSIQGTPMIVYKDKAGRYNFHLGYKPEQELERIVEEIGVSRMSAY